MFKNYIRIAIRNLMNNKVHTLTNLFGLVLGMVSVLSIFIYITDQLGYDEHHKEASLIYRINTKLYNEEITHNMATSSPPTAFTMKHDFPEIEEVCRVVSMFIGEVLISDFDNKINLYESKGYLADSTFFDVFTYDFIEGKPAQSLIKPNTVVLSATLAKKIFGDQPAIQKNLTFDNGNGKMIVNVTGVYNDYKIKSHLNPSYILTMNTPGMGKFVRDETNFASQNFIHSYIKVNAQANIPALESKFVGFMKNHGEEDLKGLGFNKKLSLQKITDIHLRSSEFINPIGSISDFSFLSMLGFLGLFIVIIACINFVNLNTARADKRAKEIGIRKTIGATKTNLMKQFLLESVLLSLLAFLISIPLVLVTLPFINILFVSEIEYSAVLNAKVLFPVFLLNILCGLIAGIYPALVLSSIRPSNILRGIFRTSQSNDIFRKALVVFQFVISVGLIIGVIIINKQIKHLQQIDLGFNKKGLIALKLGTEESIQKHNALQPIIQNLDGVNSVSGTTTYPEGPNFGDTSIYPFGKSSKEKIYVNTFGATGNLAATIGTSLIAGRNLQKNDTTRVMVNKKTLEMLNIPLSEALSTKLLNTYENNTVAYEIVGVLDDYHFRSVKNKVGPLMIINTNTPSWILARINHKNIESTLKNISDNWNKIVPNTPFEYVFVDNQIEQQFKQEKQLKKISITFAILAILISSLGLFSLLSYIIERTRKEIGIRRILGASTYSILIKILKYFLRLIVMALLIATPISYYFIKDWLEGFAYRIHIDLWIFFLAGIITISIATITIVIKAYRAANINPAHSIRAE